MSYPGGKAGSGVYQQIINQLPPHAVYISCFFGHDAIMKYKKAARSNIAIDLDARVFIDWQRSAGVSNCIFVNDDAISFLRSYDWKGGELVYADPPYLKIDVDGTPVRRSQADIYDYEFGSIEQHKGLLRLLRSLPCMVALSGYWSKLYESLLSDWRYISFNAVTRGGTVAREFLWMNYAAPVELHDYRYLGQNFREREKITRQKKRWVARLKRMDQLQRFALLDAIGEYKSTS